MFFTLAPDMLFSLIARPKPENTNKERKESLEKCTEECSTCQRFSQNPMSFKVHIPGNIVFNHEISLNLMFLDRIPELNVVDI